MIEKAHKAGVASDHFTKSWAYFKLNGWTEPQVIYNTIEKMSKLGSTADALVSIWSHLKSNRLSDSYDAISNFVEKSFKAGVGELLLSVHEFGKELGWSVDSAFANSQKLHNVNV